MQVYLLNYVVGFLGTSYFKVLKIFILFKILVIHLFIYLTFATLRTGKPLQVLLKTQLERARGLVQNV
jgi:hypothetical protein